MGSSSLTPILGLPQFGDNDKPTWRGDINSAFQIIDESISGKADKATIDYYVADYNGVGDGVTDDTPHIQAAIDDAESHGGGIVHLMRGKTHLINGEVFVKNNVLLMGDVANYNGNTGASNTPSIKYGTANSRIRVGAFAGRFGSVNGDNPNGLDHIYIDCNNQGPVAINDGALYVQGTGLILNALHVSNAAGTGVYFDAAQNSQFNSVDVQHCARGIVLDNGSGGLIFIRCEISDNMTGILSTDNQSMANAYPYGSAHVVFEHCIVENYRVVDIEVDIQAGVIQFTSCGFSNNVGATPPTSGTLVKISNPIYTGISTFAVFDSCLFVSEAGESCLTVEGNNVFYMYGRTQLQGSFDAAVNTTAFIQDGGTGLGKIDGDIYQLQIDKFVDVKNGGSVFNWFTTKSSPDEYAIDSTLNQFAIFIREVGEAGIRAAIASDGSYNFYDGTDYNQKASISLLGTLKTLYYNLAGHILQGPVEFDNTVLFDDAIHALSTVTVDGATILNGNTSMGAPDTHPTEVKGALSVDQTLTVTGSSTLTGDTLAHHVDVQDNLTISGKVERYGGIVYGVGANIVADCDKQSHVFVVLVGTGTVTGLTINNAVDGTRLRVTYFSEDANTYNVFWPAGAGAAAGKTLPVSINASGVYSVDFLNVGGNWFEMGRNF
jgi:hypothetical protein